MIWIALALAVWAGVATLVSARWARAFEIAAHCKASIANANERAALHGLAKAEAEARKLEAQRDISNNLRATSGTLSEHLETFKRDLTHSPPPRTDRPAFSVIEGDGPNNPQGAA